VVGAKKLTLQRLWLLLAGTLASAHEVLETEPALAAQETLPVGLDGLPLAVSETVAVQVVEPPTTDEAGEQLTLVDVARAMVKVFAAESMVLGALSVARALTVYEPTAGAAKA